MNILDIHFAVLEVIFKSFIHIENFPVLFKYGKFLYFLVTSLINKVKHRSLRRIRAKRNGHGDTCKENEGEVYSAGVF